MPPLTRSSRRPFVIAVVVGGLAWSSAIGCTSVLGDFTVGDGSTSDAGPDAVAPSTDAGVDARIVTDGGDANVTVDSGTPDFALSLAAPRARLVRNKSATIAITIARSGGFSGAVAITTNATDGVTADPLTIPAGATSGTLTIHGAQTATLGAQATTITALSGALSHTAPISIIVQDAPGTLDATFGTAGRVVLPIGTTSNDLASRGLAIVKDGIVVCGNAHGPQAAQTAQISLSRLGRDGALDPTFGTAGTTLMNSPGSNVDACSAMSVLPNGTIALSGFTLTAAANAAHAFVAARFTSAGVPDPAFGGTGFSITPFGTTDAKANSMIPQADGKIVSGGFGGGAIAFARYSVDGSLDKVYGSNATGTVVTTFPNAGAASSLDIQSTGAVVAAIQFSTFLVFRYTPVGILDTSFGSGGHAVMDVGGQGASSSSYVVSQPDDALVVAGSATISGGTQAMAVARFSKDGVADTTFGSGGSVALSFAGGAASANAAALADDGAIVLAGQSVANGGSSFTVARVTADGKADTSFSPDSRVTFDVGGAAETIAVDAIGRIVVGGKFTDGSRKSFVLYRLWP